MDTRCPPNMLGNFAKYFTKRKKGPIHYAINMKLHLVDWINIFIQVAFIQYFSGFVEICSIGAIREEVAREICIF
jgi:hypothetical protein